MGIRYGVRQATGGLLGSEAVYEKFAGGFAAYAKPRLPALAGAVGGSAAQLWEDRNLNLSWQKRIGRAVAIAPASAASTAAGIGTGAACARLFGSAPMTLACGFVGTAIVQGAWETVEDGYLDAIGLEPDL